MRQQSERRLSAIGVILLVVLLGACGAPRTARYVPLSAATPGGTPDSQATASRATISVTPELAIAPTAGPAGTIFNITGAGFPPNTTLHAIGRESDHSFIMSQPVTVDARGALTVRYDSRFRPSGSYTIEVGTDLQAVVMGTVLTRSAFTLTAAGPSPLVVLEPDHGPCTIAEPHILARGQNYPPGMTIGLFVIALDTPGVSFEGARGTVAADGSFTLSVHLASDHPRPGLGCNSATPEGARFRINVIRYQGNIDPNRALASATFVVATPTPSLPLLPTQPPERR